MGRSRCPIGRRIGARRTASKLSNQPPLVATCVAGGSNLGQPHRVRTGGQYPPPPHPLRSSGVGGATRCVTPRQACPRPEGFGRNLRSKTRWFTGFCNSHQVSHFATFFIDARAEISVAESRFDIEEAHRAPIRAHRVRGWRGGRALHFGFPWRFPRRGSLART